MKQETLDIRNKIDDELIDSYDLIACTILDDIRNFETINNEEATKERLDNYISNLEFKEKDLI